MEEDKEIIISGNLIEFGKDKPNMNGRIYDVDFDRMIEEFKSKIEENPNYGELNHPDIIEESENLRIVKSLITGESNWKQRAKRRKRYRFFLNIKARIYLKYLRLKRLLGLRK